MPDNYGTIWQFIAANWIGIVIGTLGVVGSIASVVSWMSARRDRRIYDKLFQVATQVLEQEAKTETLEKSIAEKQKQASEYEESVRRYSEQIVALQEQIRRDLPLAARRAVLQDRLDSSVSLMKTYYDDVVAITHELGNLGEETELSREILSAVRSQIQPRHVLRERMSHFRTLLTVITTAAAVASTLLPWPMSRILGTTLLLAATPVLVFLIKDIIIARGLNRGKRRRAEQGNTIADNQIAKQTDSAARSTPA